MRRYFKLRDNSEATHIKVVCEYEKGGTSWITGQVEQRGIYLYLIPVVYEKTDSYIAESIVGDAFSGIKVLLKEMKRNSIDQRIKVNRHLNNVALKLVSLFVQDKRDQLEVELSALKEVCSK